MPAGAKNPARDGDGLGARGIPATPAFQSHITQPAVSAGTRAMLGFPRNTHLVIHKSAVDVA